MTPSRVRHEYDPGVTPDGIADRVLLALRQFMCGLHGHEAMLHFEQERLSLRCVSCGYETPGWDLAAREAGQPIPERVAMREQTHAGLLNQRFGLASARKI